MTQDEIKTAYNRRLWALKHASEAIRDPSTLAQGINAKLARTGFLNQIVKRRFATQGGTSGTSWPALMPATIRQRARQGYAPGPILIRSGTLGTAATGGNATATAATITLEIQTGQAPYAKVPLSVYAMALNRKRPFYGPPTDQEMTELIAARNALIANIYVRIYTGHGYSDLLQ